MNADFKSAVTLSIAADVASAIIMQSGIMGNHVAKSIQGEQMHAQAIKEAALANIMKALPSAVKA